MYQFFHTPLLPLLRQLCLRLYRLVSPNIPRLTLLAALALIVFKKELNFSIQINRGGLGTAVAVPAALPSNSTAPLLSGQSVITSAPVSTPGVDRGTPYPAARPGSATARKRKQQRSYLDRFAATATTEMQQFGIPASITLAQGLLESNAGASPLATRNNNHFGIKCFSKTCKKGHCRNFSDDSHKDFFRVYPSAWESYRAHSKMLKRKKRYRKLFDLEPTDYRSWARELRRAGYATDPQYAEKLIDLIEGLELWQYDR